MLVDTSVAVPVLCASHSAHGAVRARARTTYEAIGVSVEIVGA